MTSHTTLPMKYLFIQTNIDTSYLHTSSTIVWEVINIILILGVMTLSLFGVFIISGVKVSDRVYNII